MNDAQERALWQPGPNTRYAIGIRGITALLEQGYTPNEIRQKLANEGWEISKSSEKLLSDIESQQVEQRE